MQESQGEAAAGQKHSKGLEIPLAANSAALPPSKPPQKQVNAKHLLVVGSSKAFKMIESCIMLNERPPSAKGKAKVSHPVIADNTARHHLFSSISGQWTVCKDGSREHLVPAVSPSGAQSRLCSSTAGTCKPGARSCGSCKSESHAQFHGGLVEPRFRTCLGKGLSCSPLTSH